MMTHGSPACREALELLVRLYEILVRLAPPVKDRTVFCSAQHLCLCVWGGWGWMGLFLSTYIQSTPRYTQVHIHTQYKVYKHTCTRARAHTHTHTSWCSDPWQRWHCVHSREKVSCISFTCICVYKCIFSVSQNRGNALSCH